MWSNPERFQKKFKFQSSISVAKAPKYEDRVVKDRLELKLEKSKIANEFLAKAIEFYKESFQDIEINIDLENSLNNNLDLFTESQLFEVQDILNYSHDIRPFNDNDLSRMINSVPDQDIIKRLICKIRKRIPALEQRAELEKLESQESEIVNRKIILQEQINQVVKGK